MVIYVKEIAVAADTAKQGEVLFAQLRKAFTESDSVTLSFAGIDTATSSFVNTGLTQLLGIMSFPEVKRRLKIVNSTHQINAMVKRCLTREANLIAA